MHTSSACCPHRGEDRPHQATASQHAQALDTKGANLCLVSLPLTPRAWSSPPSIRLVFTANWSWSLPLTPRARSSPPSCRLVLIHRQLELVFTARTGQVFTALNPAGRLRTFLPPIGAGLYRSHPWQVFTALNRLVFTAVHPPRPSQLPFSLAVRVSVRVYLLTPFSPLDPGPPPHALLIYSLTVSPTGMRVS